MHLITYSRVLQLSEWGLRIEGESRSYELQISSRSSLCSRCGAIDCNAALRGYTSRQCGGPAVQNRDRSQHFDPGQFTDHPVPNDSCGTG